MIKERSISCSDRVRQDVRESIKTRQEQHKAKGLVA